jgi:aryl sulfotransferase
VAERARDHGCVWLTAYPKSGNTWLRVFLANYQTAEPEPLELTELLFRPESMRLAIASNRWAFDWATGLESSDLTRKEVAHLRAAAHQWMADHLEGPRYIKVHDAYQTPGQPPLFPAEATSAIVYQVRSPLDVAVSWARHSGIDLDESIEFLNDPRACLTPGPGQPQLEEWLGSWSAHVRDWLDAGRDSPLHVVRYEDLLAKPVEVFTELVAFLGLEVIPEQVARAVELSRFERLKALEAEHGFHERPSESEAFFREGRSGGWREVLSPAQAESIVEAHGEVMQRLGYGVDLD